MRDILFRGKRVDNEEWALGYYCFRRKRRGVFGQTITEADFNTHYIIAKDGQGCSVNPETVGQYTGLTDKNGRKIFEGDIVQYQPEYEPVPLCSVVVYFADKYNYPAFDLAKHDYEANGLQCAHEEGCCEVIGNIHDNPELLKEEKQ